MFKNSITLFLIISLCFINMTISFASDDSFDLSNLKEGTITVNYAVQNNIKTKLMIESNGSKYHYNILSENQTFPLQFGNGNYTVAIFEQQDNTKYALKATTTFSLELSNDYEVYLSSNEIVSWDSNSMTTILAHELTKNLTNDKDKINAIHNYIFKNIHYDNTKFASLDMTYIPDADYILSVKSGICYDYASLFATMSRSLNIPTKLVTGYKNDISTYHAWNQVFLDDEWVTIDSTYNATLYANQFDTNLIMDNHDYAIKKTY